MSELPKFRRIEDIQRYLDEVAKDVAISEKMVEQQHKLLSRLLKPTPKLGQVMAAAFVEFDVTPGAGSGGRRGKGTLDKSVVAPSINKVVIPNLSKLKDQYGLMESLYAQRVLMDSVETQMAMQFPTKVQGPQYEATQGAVKKLRDKIDVQLQKVCTFLSDVAEKHVPKQFVEYVGAVSEAVANRVTFDSSERFLYVSVNDKSLYFTEYLVLKDAVNEDGKVAPHLYIVVQWCVGRTVEIFVEHEFTPPNQLEHGDEVRTAHEAMESISHLLDLEGFASAIGRAPLSMNMKVNPNKLTPAMFQSRDFISKILVADDGDEIAFTFKAKLDKETKKQVGYQIFQDFKTMMRNRKVKLRMKIENAKVTLFVSDVAAGSEVSVNDVEFLKERFGLSDGAVHRISQILNRDKAL